MSDYLARVAARAADFRQQVESARERNRREMPEATAWLDSMRAVYGNLPGGSVTEGGRTVTWGVMPVYERAVQASVGPKSKGRKRAP